jgi:diaminopimelate decarboxylase
MLLYQDQQLKIEEVSIADIAKKVGTPFYAYSKNKILEKYQKFHQAFSDIDHQVCYAVKANYNASIIKIFAELGSGIDAVSYGEIWKSIKFGIDPKKIIFAGVGKSEEEITNSLNDGVIFFSVESESELHLINKIGAKLNKIAQISIRVNPNVDGKTHDKISTGRKGDKFGIDIEDASRIYKNAQKLSNIKIHGIATHIGSQITELTPFKKAFIKIKELYLTLKNLGILIKNIDLGGGIGIKYHNENIIDIKDYAKMVKEIFSDIEVKLTFAPGRFLIGEAGIAVTKVIHLKKTSHKNFAIVDMAMNDFARPSLYGAYHEILQIVNKAGKKENFDIVGPVCETSDILAKNRFFLELETGDLLAFSCAGAYGSSMSNEYNARPLIAEILVDGNNFKIIRKRPSYEEMISLEKL